MELMQFKVFGRPVLVERRAGAWLAMYPGPDGKRRPAEDIVIPPEVADAELEKYLTDLCHEWATPQHPSVHRIR